MKSALLILMVLLLSGCSSGTEALDKSMQLRNLILESEQCTFDATVTAHYPDTQYQFQLTCIVSETGVLSFTVTEPDSISGISGQISGDGAAFTFDHQVLAFPVLADDRLSPVSGPWIFYHTLRSGNLSGCLKNENGYLLSIDDSFTEDPLHLQIQTNEACIPVHAEIYYHERMVLSLEINSFAVV